MIKIVEDGHYKITDAGAGSKYHRVTLFAPETKGFEFEPTNDYREVEVTEIEHEHVVFRFPTNVKYHLNGRA